MLEGLFLDPVYTARAAGGMLEMIREGKLGSGQKVLFWHTGGTPALFADKYKEILKDDAVQRNEGGS
jgi:1-aminocyclopropane-1-carboxylate deaminase/D-cysteine desulfhydrase-like pyridoxal-dependent ACC family enzyme